MAPKQKKTYFTIVPSRALDTSLSDVALAVLLLMCSGLDSDGWVKYSVAEMARRRGVSAQGLRKQIDVLIRAGLVDKSRERNPDGGDGPSRYRILYDLTPVTPEVTTRVTEMTTSEVTGVSDLSYYLEQDKDSPTGSATHSSSNESVLHRDHVRDFFVAAKACGWTPMGSWRGKVIGFISRARDERKPEDGVSAVLRRVAETGKPFFDDYMGDWERASVGEAKRKQAREMLDQIEARVRA